VTGAWAVATVASAAAVALAMLVTALVSRRLGRVSVVDVTWGLGFVLVAGTSAVVAAALDRGEATRGLVLLALVAVWGGRLAWHIGRRSRGHGEDPRYAEMLGDGGFGAAVRRVFVVQGLAIWLISLPLQVGMVAGVRSWPLVVAGVAVSLGGLVVEAVGDAQLASYRARPRDARPPILDTGLWGWTRHPNYFGDACVWWGLWLVGGLASGWLPGLLTLIAPVAMTHFLRNVTGARLLERTMSRRPGWAEYAARTPLFVPRPPRRP
jgi:steroid 5-alpha reductase family enzyme